MSAPLEIIALYPGTFDPITNGHSDVIERAALLFQRVIVAVAANVGSNKRPMFSFDERVTLAQIALQEIPNVEVRGFHGLLIDYAQACNARIILRGLRALSDFEYEFQLAGMNRRLAPGIETLFMMPVERYNYLSSSLVREISLLGGDVSEFVHEQVLVALRKSREQRIGAISHSEK